MKWPFRLYASCSGVREASRSRRDADYLGPALVPTRHPWDARNTLQTLSAHALLPHHATHLPGDAPARKPSWILSTLMFPCVPAAFDSAASEGSSCFPNRILLLAFRMLLRVDNV